MGDEVACPERQRLAPFADPVDGLPVTLDAILTNKHQYMDNKTTLCPPRVVPDQSLEASACPMDMVSASLPVPQIPTTVSSTPPTLPCTLAPSIAPTTPPPPGSGPHCSSSFSTTTTSSIRTPVLSSSHLPPVPPSTIPISSIFPTAPSLLCVYRCPDSLFHSYYSSSLPLRHLYFIFYYYLSSLCPLL